MAIPNHVLVHTAVPVSFGEPQGVPVQWIEGEPGARGVEPDLGTPFACVLFLPAPGGSADTAYRPRQVRVPTLLYNARRTLTRASVGGVPACPADNTPIVVLAEDDLIVYAAELAAWNGSPAAQWQADGDAQPFGPPGQVIGVLQQLRLVQD